MLHRGTLFSVLVAAAAACYGATWNGVISDSACGTTHAKMMAEHKDLKTDHDCTLACVKAGGKFVLVSDGKVYNVANQSMLELQQLAGQAVQVTGDLKGDTITISKVEARGK